jgi:hypothetical protein
MSEKTAEKQPTNGHLTPEEMKRAIAATEAARANDCAVAVNDVLNRFNCELMVVPVITPDGRIAATATIKAK